MCNLLLASLCFVADFPTSYFLRKAAVCLRSFIPRFVTVDTVISMQKRWLALFAAVFFLMVVTGCKENAETQESRILQDIKFLCSDECNGRLPGSKGNELARDYIADVFEQAGLTTLDGYDSFLIPYEQTVFSIEQPNQTLTAFFPDGSSKTFRSGVDFRPYTNLTGGFSGEVTTDLSDPNLSNKIYLATDIKPVEGALATVYRSNGGSAELITSSFSRKFFNCNSDVFDQLEGCVSLSLEGTLATREEQVDNVVGVLSGSSRNPKEALLITAHFDHVGGNGKAIYRGALDNASGTALMLEIVRQLSSNKNTAGHDIVFAAFNGEDMGLLGSRSLAEHLPYDTVNVVNIDCVGFAKEMFGL